MSRRSKQIPCARRGACEAGPTERPAELHAPAELDCAALGRLVLREVYRRMAAANGAAEPTSRPVRAHGEEARS